MNKLLKVKSDGNVREGVLAAGSHSRMDRKSINNFDPSHLLVSPFFQLVLPFVKYWFKGPGKQSSV
jgi:hypothetical protein